MMTVSKSALQKKAENRRLRPSEKPPLTRHEMVCLGQIQVEDLDIEELQKGRAKTHEGKFPVGQPMKFPQVIQNRVSRELRKRLVAEIEKYGIDAIDTIADVMYRGEGASERMGQKDGTGRFVAAKYMLERIVGPIPVKTENTLVVQPWEALQETQGLFVDVEVTDIKEEYNVPEDKPQARTRGPRTRPRRKAIEEG